MPCGWNSAAAVEPGHGCCSESSPRTLFALLPRKRLCSAKITLWRESALHWMGTVFVPRFSEDRSTRAQRWMGCGYFISPSFRACSAQRNRFKYGLFREFQSFHRLAQSGRRKSHMHSLSTRIGRELLPRVRASKINAARQLRGTASVSLVLIISETQGRHECLANKTVLTPASRAPFPQRDFCVVRRAPA
jgi:hypothetical protein